MILSYKSAAWIMPAAFIVAITGSLVATKYASAADPTPNAAITTTGLHTSGRRDDAKCIDTSTFFNAVIFVKYVKPDGSLIGYSKNFKFNVTAFNPYPNTVNSTQWRDWNNNWNRNKHLSITHPGGDDAGPGPVGIHVREEEERGFLGRPTGKYSPPRGGGNYCVPTSSDDGKLQLGYAFRNGDAGRYANNGNNWSWSLSCLGNTRYSVGFKFDMIGTPGDIPTGKTGHWRQASVTQQPFGEIQADDLNRKNITYEFKYEIKDDTPPPVVTNFKPQVSVDKSIVEPSEKANYTYGLNNATPLASPGPTKRWTIIDVVADTGSNVNPIKAIINGYADIAASNFTGVATDVRNKISGSATAVARSIQGQQGAFPGTIIDPEVFLIPDSARVGQKFCRLLAVYEPTGSSSATPYRYSNAACVTVGKKPKMSVIGGDVFVGRRMPGAASYTGGNASIVSSTSEVNGSRVYGGWGEYALVAPGEIIRTGSQSGLRKGSDSLNQSGWSNLTFANNEPATGFGRYSSGEQVRSIPAFKSAFELKYPLASRKPIGASPVSIGNFTESGMYYSQPAGNIDISSSNIQKGRSIIVYAPDHVVTIKGDILYTSDSLVSLSEIPQVVIIARQINITSSVRHVDAWLIASDKINTCSDVPEPVRLSSVVCTEKLIINGPVSAKDLLLRRTAGSAGVDVESRSATAETLNLRADAYLWSYNLAVSDRRATTTYTKELPPRF